MQQQNEPLSSELEMQEQIKAVLVNVIESGGGAPIEVKTDQDLLESGVLDSFGYLDFISALEKELDVNIDIASLDEQRMVSIAGLAHELTSR